MKRPIGVIISSIMLGCFAALQLLSAALYLFLAFTIHHSSATSQVRPTISTGPFFTGIMAFMSVFFAVLATWAIFTLVGLLRLRNWARYSVLVIGGCLATLGLLAVFGAIFASGFLPANPAAANLPPHAMQAAFLFIGLIYAAIATVGIWWLVYFNLHATKSAFQPAYPTPYAYDPALGSIPPGYAFPPPIPSRFPAPQSIIVIACLFLLGGAACALIAFLPFPAFLFGFILHRPASVLLYAVFAIASVLIALGLLRMNNLGRLGVYAFCAMGIINFLTLLTPWGRRSYNVYQQTLDNSMQLPGMAATQPLNTHALLIFSSVFCIIFYGIQIWLIERHRAAFLTPGS